MIASVPYRVRPPTLSNNIFLACIIKPSGSGRNRTYLQWRAPNCLTRLGWFPILSFRSLSHSLKIVVVMGFEPIAWLIVWFHYTSVTLALNVPCIASNKLADHYYNQGTVPIQQVSLHCTSPCRISQTVQDIQLTAFISD